VCVSVCIQIESRVNISRKVEFLYDTCTRTESVVLSNSMAGLIHLTPSQSIAIYGYKRPLRLLNWKIAVDRTDLTFRFLFGLGVTEKQMAVLQPDKMLWITEKGLQLKDVVLVPSWRIHVTKDMGASIVEIAMLNLTADFLHHTGVTFTDLVDVGLTLHLMMIFKFSLTSWIHLGLYKAFLADLTDIHSIAMFGLPKNMALMCFEGKSMKDCGDISIMKPDFHDTTVKKITPILNQVGSNMGGTFPSG
jgi:hypothetical protein